MKELIGRIWPEALIVALIIFLCLACWMKSTKIDAGVKRLYAATQLKNL